MEKAIQIIKHYEQLHDGDLKAIGLQPKLCPADVWTVGYGRAIIDPSTGKQLKGIENKNRAYELYPSLSIEQAEQFLKENKTEMPIEEIDEEGVSLILLPQLRKKIIETKRKINDIGAKEVHLFYQGPVAFAFFIADTLNNWIPVYIYHLNKEKGYECWGLLTETLERLATENFIKEITKSG